MQRALATASIAALIAAGCAGPADAPPDADGYTPVSGFADIHGLAVSPERPWELYAATHHGLFRATNDTGWARVGASQDDYMGFTIHPSDGDTFWASGHPRGGGNMGVRMSTDRGFTWTTIGASGADFHAMAVSPADPDRLWGSHGGRIHRSDDGGRSWRSLAANPEPLRSLVAHPTDAEVVYAVGVERIWRSVDGGATWAGFLEGGDTALGISPAEPQRWLRVGPSGAARSDDGGASWTPLALDLDGGTAAFVAFDWRDAGIAYVASYETAIHKTADGGASWTRVKAP